ncbi:MAG TPA: penicillin-binding transpeptidase domain-containing protein [Symbiobacteriaceae bacterium]|nr:penicillin-binding transpeptidase domain-containing protein [Symbiobacteriaceae bacterium]
MQRVRINQFRAIVLLCLAVIVCRLVWIQGVKAQEIVALGDRRQDMDLTPFRGAIIDRTGRNLAVSVPVWTVVADAPRVGTENVAKLATLIGPLMGMDPAAIQKRITDDPTNGYIKLKERIDLTTADKVQKAVQEARLDGITVIPDAVRQYPQGATSLNLLGYLDSESRGAAGLELSYEKQLRGQPGWVKAELTQSNTPISGTVTGFVPSEPGLDLVLALDISLQERFERKLDAVVKEQDAKRALAIAMDVHTGEILAMAQSPRESITNRANWNLANPAMKNWAISEVKPPGSIFKTLTSSIALEERTITPQTLIGDDGKLKVGGATIFNWDQYVPAAPKPSTLSELMQRSSNVGLIKVGQSVNRDKYVDYLEQFGLFNPTGIDLPDEVNSVTGGPFNKKLVEDWANIYIGQHMEYTPIQVMTAIAAVANGGYLVQPHLVKEIRDPAGQVVEAKSAQPRRNVITEETAKEVQSIMIDVIEKGYPQAMPKGYRAGGKTGTAQLFENGKMKERGLGDFIGFAPANNPQVLLMVMIDEPRPPGYGGQIASPVFAELMPQVMQAIGIPPESAAAEGNDKAPPKVVDGIVPEVRWLPVERAKERLIAAGFAVDVQGKGSVVATQSAAPGAPADRKKAVTITLTNTAAKQGFVRVPSFLGLSLPEAAALAKEVGLSLKGMVGTGFVSAQEHAVGAEVPRGATLSLRLAPPATLAKPNG